MQLRSSRLHSAGYGDGLLKAVRAVVKISQQTAVQRLRVSGSVQRLSCASVEDYSYGEGG